MNHHFSKYGVRMECMTRICTALCGLLFSPENRGTMFLWTNYMEHSPPWKATVPQTLTKFPTGSLLHSHRLPLVTILSQKNPVHTLPFYWFKIHFHIVRPSMSRSSKLPLSFRLPYQNPVCNDLLLQTCHMSYSFNPSLFLHPNNIQQIR